VCMQHLAGGETGRGWPFGLNTILSSPILYCVRHNKGGIGGGGAYISQRSCNSIAIG